MNTLLKGDTTLNSSRSARRLVAAIAAVAAPVTVVGALILVVPHHGPSQASTAVVAGRHPGRVDVAPGSTAGSSPTSAAPGSSAPSSTTSPQASTSAPAAHSAAAPPVPTTAAGATHVAPTTPTTRPPAANPAPVPSGPAPATAGTYRYRQVGSLPGTPAEGTLVVAPASASGTQVWTRSVGGTVPPATSVMLFNANGAYLMSPGGQVAGAGSSCTFAAPVPWPPWPTTPGTTVSGHASCTGGISSFNVTGHVQGTASVTVAGQTVNAAVVVNTLVLSGVADGSALNVTLTETDYYAPTLRVPVLTVTHVAGTAIGLPVTTDRTDTLESL